MHIFSQAEYRRDCLILAGAFFGCMLSSYSYNNWLPANLAAAGVAGDQIGFVTATFHLGSIIGIPIGSLLIMRWGSRLLLPSLCAGAAFAAIILTGAEFWLSMGQGVLSGILVAEAAMIAIVQVALYSVAVHVFPNEVRATGIGFSAGIGRLGAFASSFTAAAALYAGGAPGFFLVVTIFMTMSGLFLVGLKKHIPRMSHSTT
jgi:AAHS family 4-hydroxybenzoate transporter-like MFS transporter